MITNNYSINQPVFKAHVPNTLGKKSVDVLAKKFLESGNKIEMNYANKYFEGIKKLEQTKEINEAIIVTSGKKSMPYIKYDGVDMQCWDMSKSPQCSKLLCEDKTALNIMATIIEHTKKLPDLVKEIATRGK
ncbi:hypothetical protein IKJ53_01490 [bacterium]|nr:hypothetical protein [bacterium]